jgi:hypothetical protein
MAGRSGRRNKQNRPTQQTQKKNVQPVKTVKKVTKQTTYAPPPGGTIKNVNKTAARDVGIALDRPMEEIARAGNEAYKQYVHNDTRVDSAYRGLENMLGQNFGMVQNDFGQAMGNLNQNLQGLNAQGNPYAQAAGPQGPAMAPQIAAEQAAAGQVNSDVGQAALGTMGAMQASNAMYQGSIMNQAGMERANHRRNYLEQYRDTVDALRNRRLDIFEDYPEMLESRQDELRQRKFDERLQLAQYGLNEQQVSSGDKLRKFLADWIEGELGGGGRGRNNGGGRTERISGGQNQKGEDVVGSADTGTGGSAADLPGYGGGGGKLSMLSDRRDMISESISGVDENYGYNDERGGFLNYEKRGGVWYANFGDGSSLPINSSQVAGQGAESLQNMLQRRRRTNRKIDKIETRRRRKSRQAGATQRQGRRNR